MRDINSMSRGECLGATHYHAQLGLPDKGRAIKGLVVCNSWDLEPLELLNGLALVCFQRPLRYDSYMNKVGVTAKVDLRVMFC